MNDYLSNGPIDTDALQFLSELGSWRLAETTGDVRASSFLFQRISVVVQRFNSVLLHDGFIDDYRPEYGALINKSLSKNNNNNFAQTLYYQLLPLT